MRSVLALNPLRMTKHLKKLCIVGASGKLGQYMVQHALDRGYEVVGVSRGSPGGDASARCFDRSVPGGLHPAHLRHGGAGGDGHSASPRPRTHG